MKLITSSISEKKKTLGTTNLTKDVTREVDGHVHKEAINVTEACCNVQDLPFHTITPKP